MDRKIKLVVADIDGTIQTTGTPMSEKNLWAIEELHRRGYLFGLASGKNLFDIVVAYPVEYGNWVEMKRGTTGILRTYAHAEKVGVTYLKLEKK